MSLTTNRNGDNMDFEVDTGDSMTVVNMHRLVIMKPDGTIGQLQNGGICGMYTSVLYFNVLANGTIICLGWARGSRNFSVHVEVLRHSSSG